MLREPTLRLARAFFSSVVTLIFFTAIGCGSEPPENRVFPQSSTDCKQLAIPNQFIVHWTDGSRSVFTGFTREELIEKVVKPRLEEIARVDYDVWLMAPSIPDLKPVPTVPAPTQKISANWGLLESHASQAWQRGIYGEGVTVAVVDSGVDYNHPKLSNQVAYNVGESGIDSNGQDKRYNSKDDDGNGFVDDYLGYNFAYKDEDPNDLIQHGTHVAGIIAAAHSSQSVSESDVQGVAPKAKILPVAFIGNSSTGGSVSDALDALDYAALRKADIVNASWGGVSCAPSLGEKVIELGNKGILFVSASGNYSKNIDQYLEFPASFGLPNQITVGSIGRELGMAEHSNYGSTYVNLFAPGYRILSTLPHMNYGEMTGTSMATPFVSGALALMKSHRPQATIADLKQALYAGVDKGNYLNSTSGRLNIGKALNELEKLFPANTTP